MPPRALFINPPLVLGRDFIDYPWFANFGLLSRAAQAARAGMSVEVFDAFSLPGSGLIDTDTGGSVLGVHHEEFLASIPVRHFDLVVIGVSPFLVIGSPDERTAGLVDGIGRAYESATVVLADCHAGGMHYIEYDAERVLRNHPGIDAVVRYAGERTFEDAGDLVGLKGSHRVIDDPDVLTGDFVPPYPMFDAVDQSAAARFLWRVFSGGKWANTFNVGPATRPFMTSTGCPHRCVFCTSNPGWSESGRRKPYRAVPLPVVEQWAYLTKRLTGADRLFVMDEMANVRKDFEGMLASLNRMGLMYEFPNGLRADRLSRRAIELMKDRIGLLSLSAETADQDALDGPVGKGLDLASVENAVRDAHEVGIPTLVHYIVGFPWEEPAHVQATLGLAWRLWEAYGATPAVQFATPMPGTRLHEMCREQGLVPEGGFGVGDESLFQHEPAFVPKGLAPGYLETASATLKQKIEASSARKVIINITYECINKCAFCAVSNRVRRPIPWPKLEEMIRRHRDEGIDQLDLDGGEPTLHENLFDAVRLARSIGYAQVNVTTNGRRLSEDGFAKALLSSGITNLLISVHGHQAAVHDSVTRVPGSFAETMAGLRAVVSSLSPGVGFGVNTTISRHNVDHLSEIVAMLCSEGVRRVNFQLLTPFGAAGGHVVPDVRQAAGAVMSVIDEYSDRMEIQVINAQFCFFPGYERYLAGDMQKMGRSMVFVTEDEVNLFDYLAARREKTGQCADCPWSLVCEGFHVFGEGESDVEP